MILAISLYSIWNSTVSHKTGFSASRFTVICEDLLYCNILIKRFYSFAVDDPHNLVSWKLGKVGELGK